MSIELLPPSPTAGPITIEKPWGHELIWANNPHYAGKVLHVNEGCRLSLQYHVRKRETLLVIAGRVRMTMGTPDGRIETFDVGPGAVFEVLPGQVHRIEALETSDLVEVSTPDLDDVVRLSDDYGRSRAAA